MIILFLIDTSTSMNQKTSSGMSLLDVSKSAVEHFVKFRTRHNDKWMLVTCGEQGIPYKDNDTNHFLNIVKNLEANDLTEIGVALKKGFDLLNMTRLHDGTDSYGTGRNPHLSQPSMIILVTDGAKLTSLTGIMDTLTLPNPQTYASLLTHEPFRWDQRVFSITLSIPSLLGGEPPAPTANPIAAISDVTGGQVRNITNMKGMMTLMEELAGIYASQHAVVINFEVVKNTTNVTSRSIVFNGQHTLVHIYPHRDAQTDKSEKVIWPIPETYFPSSSLTSFQTRFAQPTIHLVETPVDYYTVLMNNKFIFYDLYEIDPKTPLYHFMLQTVNTYLCYVIGSKGNPATFGDAFGFVRKFVDEKTVRVIMYILPYNFLRFFTFYDEAKNAKIGPTQGWKANFEKYVRETPPYYHTSLKNAWRRSLQQIAFPMLSAWPDHLENQSGSLDGYLRKLKKMEQQETEKIANANKKISAPVLALNPNAPEPNAEWSATDEEERVTLVQEVVVNKNPFDIDRANILNQLRNMSVHLFGIAKETEKPSEEPVLDQIDTLSRIEIRKHSVPISQMGNFEQIISKKHPLRDPLADSTTQQHSFGSPFQKRKRRRSKGDIRANSPTSNAKDGNVTNMNVNEGQVLRGASDEVEAKFVGDEMDIVAMEQQQLNHQDEITHLFENQPVAPAETAAPVLEPVKEQDAKEIKEQERKIKKMEDRVKLVKEISSIEVNGTQTVVKIFANMSDKVLEQMYLRSAQLKVPRQQVSQIQKIVRQRRKEQSSLGKRKREEEEEEEINAVFAQLAEIEFYDLTVEKMVIQQLIATARDFRKKTMADRLIEYMNTRT